MSAARVAELESLNQLELTQLQARIAEKEAEILSVRERLSSRQEELDNAAVELAALRSVYDEQQQLVADLKAGARLSRAILKANKLVDQQMHLEQMATHKDRIHALQQQVTLLQKQRISIEEQNAYRAAQELFDQKLLEDREQEISLQRQEIQALFRKVQEVNVKLNEMMDSQLAADKREDSLQDALLKEKSRVLILEEQLQDLSENLRFNQMATKLDEIAVQSEKLIASEEKRNQLVQQIGDISADFRTSQRELDETKASLCVVQRAFQAKISELAKLKVEMLEMEDQIEEQSEELEKLKQVVQFEQAVSQSAMKAARATSAPAELDSPLGPTMSRFP